jgi:hypothetical protein
VRKPEGHLRTAAETSFCLLAFCLPYWQSLLLAGISGSLSFLCFTVLLMFVVGRAPHVYTVITGRLEALPLSRVLPDLAVRRNWLVTCLCRLTPEPALAPSFQRPPPLLS